MKKFATSALAILLAGCAYQVTMMPRDSGKVYQGTFNSKGNGTADMSVTIEGTTYSGQAVRVSSNDSFGFAQMFGSNNRGGKVQTFGTSYQAGDVTMKAIMSSPDGKGLRCDVSGRDATGGGICVDDMQRIYDVVLVRK